MSDIPYTTVISPGILNQNETTEAGLLFGNQTNEDVIITKLARWVHPGNTQTHTLKIYALGASPATLLSSVVVDCSSVAAGQFVWGTLPAPITIPKGTGCAIVSTEVAGGDSFANAYGAGTPSDPNFTVEDIGGSQEVKYNGTTFSYYGGPPPSRSWGPVTFAYSAPVRTWTKLGTTYTTDGTYYQILSAIAAAGAGDTVLIPAGTYTWGEGGVRLSVKAGVILAGAGQGATVINMHSTATTGFTSTLLSVGSGCVIRDMSFIGSTTTPLQRASLFATGTSTGWRITNITFTQQSGQSGYFLFGQYTPNGLVDNCTITGGTGNTELIFTRGRSNSWTTPDSIGGEDNIFIEDCTFNGGGYVNDANSNARHVVRNCTINGAIKVDGHGFASNGGPPRGFRHMEVYRNTWSVAYDFWTAIEIRGGSGMVFGNRLLNRTSSKAWFYLTDYGATATWPNFLSLYQTPTYYPIKDQIGVGMDPKVAASAPMYLWDNLAAASANAGTATVDWTLTWKAIPAAAITQYRSETGNPTATFTVQDLIAADRDYFKHTQGATFDGSTGVGIGTRAQMDAITPSNTGVGFWVTDEGDWDTTLPAGTSGQLYAWSGSAWVLKYVPYVYPHPLRGAVSAPIITASSGSQTVDAGATVTMSVTASANPAPTYQWRKDEVALPGATSSILTLLLVSEASEGSYDCVVTNNEGVAISTPATLTVNTVSDTTPPTPNPATFASVTVVSSRQITVVASTATDVESMPVEYNFAKDGVWTGWQSSPLRYFTELTPSTEYTFLTKSRDAIGNEGQQSAPATATTNAPEPTSPASVMGNRGTRARRLGIF